VGDFRARWEQRAETRFSRSKKEHTQRRWRSATAWSRWEDKGGSRHSSGCSASTEAPVAANGIQGCSCLG
jgi:hypothetical protein